LISPENSWLAAALRQHWARTRAGSTSTAFEDATLGAWRRCSLPLNAQIRPSTASTLRSQRRAVTMLRFVYRRMKNASEAAAVTAVIAAWRGSFSQGSSVTTARSGH